MQRVYSNSLRLSISAILALVLWVFVSFTENPQQTTPVTNLPVVAEGLAPQTTLVDSTGVPMTGPDAVVNVSMVGPSDVVSSLSKQQIQPYVNLAGLEPGVHRVPVNVRVIPYRQEVSFQSITPAEITVEIEQLITTTVPLTITTIGQPPTSYEASVPQAISDNRLIRTVTVSGPASQVARVIGGEVELDLSSQTANVRARRNVLPVDVDGREVEGVQVQPSEVRVDVNILSSSGIKRVPIVYTVGDTPPPGFRPAIVLEPAFVSIIGSSRALSGVEFIETQPLLFEGQTADFTKTLRLRFPPGIVARDPGEGDATVALVDMQPITTTFAVEVPVNARNLAAETAAAFEPAFIEVVLSGDAALLASARLNATIDADGREPGTYTLQPSLTLPPGLALVSALPQIEVTIRSLAPPPSPTAQPAPPPSTPATTPSAEPAPATTIPITPTLPPDPEPPPEPSPTP